MDLNIIDEQHPGKVAGIYDQEAVAQQAIKMLKQEGSFSTDEINLIHPNDVNFGQKVEPDSKGIGRTIVKSHIVFGVIGLLLGLIGATIVISTGAAFATSSPIMTFLAFAILGLIVGALVAGLVSLRPDHDPLINNTRHATTHNQWTVVVQTKDHAQIEQARKILKRTAVSVSETL